MSLEPDKTPRPFDAGMYALSPRFPAMGFASMVEFAEQAPGQMAARGAYERSLTTNSPTMVQSGTCAPCLRATRFTSGGAVPDWRDALACDCADPLNNRERALLHFAQADGILPWTRLLLLGSSSPVDARLAALAGEVVAIQPWRRVGDGFHLAISPDYLQFVPNLAVALAGICAALMQGGRFIFTVPFQPQASASTLVKLQGEAHAFGWDLLEMLAEAGFRDARAYHYWSEELGYLGGQNFIFRAVR